MQPSGMERMRADRTGVGCCARHRCRVSPTPGDAAACIRRDRPACRGLRVRTSVRNTTVAAATSTVTATRGLAASVPAVTKCSVAIQKSAEARKVDRLPPAPWHPAHEQGAELDGNEEIETHNAECDWSGLPGRRQGHQEVGDSEVGVAVGDKSAQVQSREDDCSTAEEAVQVSEPGGSRAASGETRADQQAPDDRCGE